MQACCIWMPYIKSDGEWYVLCTHDRGKLMIRLANKVLQGASSYQSVTQANAG
jgi:hypothetical protein